MMKINSISDEVMISKLCQMTIDAKILKLYFFSSLTKPQSFADCVGDELPVGFKNYHDDYDDNNGYDDHNNDMMNTELEIFMIC